MRQRFVGCLLAVSALVAGACGSNDSNTGSGGSSTVAGSGALTLGLLVPESGDLRAIVNSLVAPTKLAVDQINAAGGVNGQPVVLKQADDGTDAQVASASFDKLVNGDKVNAIVGPAPSGAARGILDKIKSQAVTTCSGSTTAADLTKKDSGGYFFRTAPTDDLQGPALAEVITNDGKTKVAILARNDDYGVGFAKAIESSVKDSGGQVVANVAYNPGGSNFDGDVSQVLAAGPDAVAVIGFNDDGGKIVSTLIAKGAGPDKMAIYTADGMQGSSFYKAVDPNDPAKVKGIKGTAPAAAPSGITSPFQAEYAKLNVDTIFSPYYWDCTNLIALAAVKAKSSNSTAIRDNLSANLKGDNDCSDFASCKQLLDDGKTIHYRGASNRYDKWSGQEPGTGSYDVWNYDDKGKPVNLPVPQISIT